jgi:DNA-binding CsgD family transcriptional regulator
VLGELFFDVGRWDDALTEVDADSFDAETADVDGVDPDSLDAGARHPVVECNGAGLAAAIGLHRGSSAAGRRLEWAERYATGLGTRVVRSLALARSLAHEQAGAPMAALAVLTEDLPDTTGPAVAAAANDVEDTTDLYADAVRLALAVGDKNTAQVLAHRAEAASGNSAVPHRRAVALHCRGLLDQDAVLLLRAADEYQTAGRLLPRAQALEAAGVALAERADAAGARTRFTEAFGVYTELGAGWDLARTQARFRLYGIRRGPRLPHKRAQRGWESLTPTEVTVAGLVASGLSNPDIGARLFLSRRTVQTHVSHILAKLDLHSRTDIAREAMRRDLNAN